MPIQQKLKILFVMLLFYKNSNYNNIIVESVAASQKLVSSNININNLSCDLYIRFVLQKSFYNCGDECKKLYEKLLFYKNNENRYRLFKLILNLQQKIFTLDVMKPHFNFIYSKITKILKNSIDNSKCRIVESIYNKQVSYNGKVKRKLIKQLQEIKYKISRNNGLIAYILSFVINYEINDFYKLQELINNSISFESIYDKYNLFLHDIMNSSGLKSKNILLEPLDIYKCTILVRQIIDFAALTYKQFETSVFNAIKGLNFLLTAISNYIPKKVEIEEVYKYKEKQSTAVFDYLNTGYNKFPSINDICQIVSILFIEEDYEVNIYEYFCRKGLSN